jgi:cyclohexyl-isocyanide hydratase
MTINRREFAERLGIAAGAFSLAGPALLPAVAQQAARPASPAAGHDMGMGAFYRRLADSDADLAAINPAKRREIVMLAYPGMFPLDLVGPHSVLSGLPNTRVQIAWKTKAPIAFQGFSLTPTATLEECPEELDVLFVPGGGPGTFAALNDDAVLAFLQSRAARARHVTSVCTGSLVLAAAGLLNGKRATTHWVAFPALERLGARPVHERVVEDGSVMTAAGVSAGIDFALTLAARMTTETFARALQLNIEYDPHPPFQAGSPAGAGERVASAMSDMYAPMMAGGMQVIERRLKG